MKTESIEIREIKAVIFDMDNTLFDFVDAKMKACEKVSSSLGTDDGSELFKYFLRDGVGFEDLECIADYLRDKRIYEESTYKRCCDIYEKAKLRNIETYDGVEETLRFLKEKGYKLGLVTNADRKNLDARLKKTNLICFFDITVSSEETGEVKPNLSPLILALKNLELEAKEVLKVGDSLKRDISPANELGMVTAYAEYGDRNIGEGEGNRNPDKKGDLKPDLTLRDIRDLTKLFKSDN